MIWESAHWKEPLAKDADIIERWAAKTRHTPRRYTIMERKIMLSAFVMRKLMHSGKLSTSFADRQIGVAWFPSKSNRITTQNAHQIDKLYSLDMGRKKPVPVRRLLDQIIHSLAFVLHLAEEDDRATGFFVNSERDRNKLLLVPIPKFAKLMRDISRDYPSHSHWVFDETKNDWFVWSGYGSPPRDVALKIEAISKKRSR